MKFLLFTILIFAGTSVHAESYWNPEEPLRRARIDEFSLPKGSVSEVAEILSLLAKENGINLKIKFIHKAPDFTALQGKLSVKNISLYDILRILFDQDPHSLEFFGKSPDGLITVVCYRGLEITAVRVTSTLPQYGEESFRSLFTIDDFLKEESIPESVSVRFNWERDFLQITARLNHLMAKGAKVTDLESETNHYGLLSGIETQEGIIYFGISEKQYGFLNLSVPDDAIDNVPWFCEGMIYLLPSDYHSRLRSLLEWNAFAPIGMREPSNADNPVNSPENPENQLDD